ncbi:MAG: exodeoxyribonuclease V subunit gamma, partial [Opitutae bacterium]
MASQFLPARLSVFGISTLPPIFLDILHTYSRYRLLHIYSLQPAPVMWGDVQSEKWKQRAIHRLTRKNQSGLRDEDLGIESGNPLIGSLGRTGREFFNLLVDRNANDIPLDFRNPCGKSLLHALQRWTFDVFTEYPKHRPKYDPDDSSIRIVSCHSPMREVEALRDYLLHRFAEDSTLRPNDIVVMMPNPEEFAPYIRAAFGESDQDQSYFFPYSIVDREPHRASQLVNFFFNLLEFFQGRASNRELIDLLDSPPMRSRFELSDEDIDLYRLWIRQCHVYWGFDSGHRESVGSTSTNEHTWKHALDRMALGYCMRSHGTRTWHGILPHEEVEGDNVSRFAKLYHVVQLLGKFEESSRRVKSLTDWKEFLVSISSSFFPQDNETLLDRQRINQAVEDLSKVYGALAPHSQVPLRVIGYHLNNVVESGTPQGQFLTRGVTFCGLRPMRSVNARIICMLGLNERSFPRQNQSLSFDLSGDRRPGDRSVREDDRYLFLESLWCARDHLYLSYVGQSIRQNEKIPPSVLINE